MDSKILVTCECAPNIALVKYWGKQDEDLIIPLNSSLSVTLDINILRTKTSVMLIKKDDKFNDKDIKIWFDKCLIELNDNEKNINEVKNNDLINIKRFLRVLNKIRSNCKLDEAYSYAIRICTYNTFPTACGLASSASGNACMALALANAFGYHDNISELARLGSGSACRSCYGGFVKWLSDPKESLAVQLFNSQHWKEFNVLILILNDKHKDVSSTKGMKNSSQTSELLKERVKLVESQRIVDVSSAIDEKNFSKLSRLIMQDSNQFHAICLDTFPPLFYLNQKSIEIINFVNAFNKYESDENIFKVAYSFDAGPNAFIFILDEYLNEFLNLIKYFYFENISLECFLNDKFITKSNLLNESIDINEKKLDYFKKLNFNQSKSNDFIKFIMHSKVGDDPKVYIDDHNYDVSLLDRNGQPKDEISDEKPAKRIKFDDEFITTKPKRKLINKKVDNKFNVYVVEDHNDALEKIYKEIGSKIIPFQNLTLIHFDSHPDLSLSRTLNDELVFNKELLFSNLSIENWILPAAYAGHINQIIWIKPEWSKQIKSGKYEFYIGLDKQSRYLRVSCREIYFLSELIYSNEENLLNKKLIKVYVIDFNDLLILDNTSCSFKNEVYLLLKQKSVQTKLKDVIIDIDLDFFSTLDPFKELFQDENAYNLFKKLYYVPIIDKNDENFDLNYDLYKHKKHKHMDRILGYLTNSSNDTFDDNQELYSLLKEYSSLFLKNLNLNIDILHNYGEGIDDIGLPHHKTSQDELRRMFESFEQFLKQFFIDSNLLPGLITIARSSLDDYCPSDQVDFIQNEVIMKLKLIFDISIGSIVYDYDNNN